MTFRRKDACRLVAASIVALIATILVSTAAFAQNDSTPKWDLFAGYQFTRPGGIPSWAE